MIGVKQQPEPSDFDLKVRIPGRNYIDPLILNCEKITSAHFKGRDYWKRCLPELKAAFGNKCAYSGYIVSSPGEVDHFESKTSNPNLAYEWSNFRFCCPELNRKKSTKDSKLLDPFEIQPGWFKVEIPTFELKLTPKVPMNYRQKAEDTIEHLGLNDRPWRDSRQAWIGNFLTMLEVHIDVWNDLYEKVPMLAIALLEYADETGSPTIVF